MRVCKYCKQEWKNGQIQCQSCGSKSFWDIEETESLNRPNNIVQEASKDLKDRVKRNRTILVVCIIVVITLGLVIGKKIKISVEEKKAFQAEMIMSYEQGMAYYENGDYASAIKNLRKIEETYELYPEVLSTLSEIEGVYKTEILNEVELLVEQENFTEAATKMTILKEIFSDDVNISVKTQNIQKQSLLKSVEGFLEEEKYEEILILINKSETEVKEDLEVQEQYEEAKNQYISNIAIQAEDAYNEGGVPAALSVINAGINLLPDNAELIQMIEEYNERIPVDLFEIASFTGDVNEAVESGVGESDNVGNSYYKYWAKFRRSEYSISWLLGGEYKKLEFDIGVSRSQDPFGAVADTWIEVKNGNRTIYNTSHFVEGVKPEHCVIDVQGVDELTITFHRQSENGLGFSHLLLSELWISK